MNLHSIINRFRESFKFGAIERRKYTYTGLDFEVNFEEGKADFSKVEGKVNPFKIGSVIMHQKRYSQMIDRIDIDAGERTRRPMDSRLSPEEISMGKTITGQTQWLAGNSRPDLAHGTISLNSELTPDRATFQTLFELNKLVRRAKVYDDTKLIFRPLGDENEPLNVAILSFHDANFGIRSYEGMVVG